MNSILSSFKKFEGPLTFIAFNIPGIAWLIFAVVAIIRAIKYTTNSFWESIPSADPRISHSIDHFTDAKPFMASPTFSK